MKTKRGKLKYFVAFIFVIAILHSVLQLTVFTPGFLGFYERGISGFSVGKTDLGDELESEPISPLSRIFLIAEWTLLIIGVVFLTLKKRSEIRKELIGIDLKKYSAKGKKTELDTLYNLLKEKKSLHIGTIAKAFNVDKALALKWAKTLEEGKLAAIDYPKFGEPEVSIRR